MADGTIGKDEDVVCILTGHELKDADVTVKYHTGIDMKAAQDLAPRGEPHGKLSNRPIPVADDLLSIVKALGGDESMLAGVQLDGDSELPVSEY